jgi:heme-degrading monooxygenase HmoA
MTAVRIATYDVEPGNVETLTERVNDSLVPIYREQPGFESLSVVDCGGEVVSVSRWDSREHAEQGGRAALGWAGEQSDLIKGNTGSHFGDEVVSSG